MEIAKVPLTGLLTGTAFGYLLEKSKVYLPHAIKNQMLFTNNTMLKVFLSATTSGLIGISAMHALELVERKAKGPAHIFGIPYGANIIGGLILGVGMTFAGACPGTIFAQISTGVPNALYTILGGLGGCLLYGLFDKKYPREVEEKPKYIDEMLQISYFPCALIFAATMATGIYYFNKQLPWQHDTLKLVKPILAPHIYSKFPINLDALKLPAWSPMLSGALIGLLQVPSGYIMKTFLGTSSSFCLAVGKVLGLVDEKQENIPYFSKFGGETDFWQLFLVGGMALGAYISTQNSGHSAHVSDSSSPLMSALGGACLLFGARMAGGCTSGHGISGMAQLSFPSMISVCSMFAGGIGTAVLLKYLK